VVAADDQGMWLRVESAVLEGIDRTATFLVILPFDKDKFPKAWGFWNKAGGPEWIGKRHTNFPDGDVCAFVPESLAWLPSGDLVALFDLYSVWALRQLHLEEFGRWPGRQFSAHPFYSLIEFKPDELCSCDKNEPPLTYGNCCRPGHLAMDLIQLKAGFERRMGYPLSSRTPPKFIIEHMNGKSDLPAPAAIVGSIKSQPELMRA
jgi:hypothetical protein